MQDRIAVRGQPTPGLIVHEVAHTIQQERGASGSNGSTSAAEADAGRAATAVAFGRPASVQTSANPAVPLCFKFSSGSQKDYPKAAAYLRDEMPKVANDPSLLKSVLEAARTTESKVTPGLAWDAGPLVTPKMLSGTRAGVFHPHQGSQELEIHKGELDKWEAEKDPGLNESCAFWLEATVLHEYVHFLGDNREKDKDEEWGKDFEEKAYGNSPATRDAAWNRENFLRARFRDGEYQVRVTGKEAAFKQRFRIVGATSGDGTYDGVPGMSLKVSKDFDLKGRWEIIPEHDEGTGAWKTSNLRMMHVSIGSEWLIRIEDWSDRDYNDLEISVKSTASAKPPPAAKP